MVERFSFLKSCGLGWVWGVSLWLCCFLGGSMALASVGVVTEYAMPDGVSAPQSVVVDGAGLVWFTEKIGKNLVQFDPEKRQFTAHALPDSWGSVGPSRLALSRQGEIWFTVRRWVDGESAIHLLGQFIPGQHIFKSHPLPAGVVPEELVVDHQNGVWFTNPDNNRIQRFDPNGAQLKGYTIPTPHAYPRGLALDKAGGVWFSESNINRLGYFNPVDETFQEYELPTPFANPGAVAVDREGRIWFVEMTANQIGAFYPDLKRFDERMIPTQRGMPDALATDGEGGIWVLEYRGNRVGYFRPREALFQEYDIPTYGSLPGSLAIDVERGRLWFSETSTEAKKLGMIDMRQLPMPVGATGSLESAPPQMDHRGMDHSGMDQGMMTTGNQADRTVVFWGIGLLVGILFGVVGFRMAAKRRGSS